MIRCWDRWLSAAAVDAALVVVPRSLASAT